MEEKARVIEPERFISKKYKDFNFALQPMAAIALLYTVKEYLEDANGHFMTFDRSNGLHSTYLLCKELLQTKEVQQYCKEAEDDYRLDHSQELTEFYSHDIDPGDTFIIKGLKSRMTFDN